MELHFFKAPNGDTVNLAHIFFVEVNESSADHLDHCVWVSCADSSYDLKAERNYFSSRAIAWGSKEYCESIKEQIDNLIAEHYTLATIKGENTTLEVKEEPEEKEPEEIEEEPISFTSNLQATDTTLNSFDDFDEQWGAM